MKLRLHRFITILLMILAMVLGFVPFNQGLSMLSDPSDLHFFGGLCVVVLCAIYLYGVASWFLRRIHFINDQLQQEELDKIQEEMEAEKVVTSTEPTEEKKNV